MENLPFWTDERLSWSAVGLMAYCERMSITQIDGADLAGFLRGAYYHHPDDRGDLDDAVNQLLSVGYLQAEGDVLFIHGEG